MNLQEIIQKHHTSYCMDCGKCSAVCPITHWESRAHVSPRLLIEKAVRGSQEEFMEDPLFWSCLICKRCTEICPSNINFAEFLRDARSLARSFDRFGDCTHSEMIQTWGKMMTNPNLRQKRLNWLGGGLTVSETSDTLYFVGCLPYFDPLFQKLNVEGVEIARATVKILNHLGIKPQVLPDECCCGHDQLWEGDLETFRALATLNIERLKSSKAKRIVTACPECARTLKIDYPKLVGDHGLEVLHISEFLAQNELPAHIAKEQQRSGTITFQDPCHLGRHLGIYDAPRQVLTHMGYQIIEMERSRNTSLCCGTSCWRSCGQVSKSIQVDRLQEAKATGAKTLVTACVKCQIHFRCAQNDPILEEQLDIEIRDLTTMIASLLP